MKNKIKKLIILLIIIALLISVIIVIMNGNKNQTYKYSFYENEVSLIEEERIKYEKNKITYCTVISVINKYIYSASSGDSVSLMNMLDKNYAQQYNINANNVINMVGIPKLQNNSEYYIYEAVDMLSIDTGNISNHFVYGYYYNIVDREEHEFNLMVQLDKKNKTFNIYNYKYMVDNGYNKLKVGDSFETNIQEIENRGSNTYEYIQLNDEKMAEKYFNHYKDIMLYKPAKAYEMLDEEYAKLKFGDIREFGVFIANNKDNISTAELSKYKVETNESGNKVYICQDQNDNYYYFIENGGVMRYKVMLDNYVLPYNYESKYLNASEQEKLKVNIQKFIYAVNDKSYYYAYSCLADSFKNNYFKTQAEFENYVKTNFAEKNSVEYTKFEKQNDLYICNVTINKTIKKTFIIQLGEGTDFVLAFSVE